MAQSPLGALPVDSLQLAAVPVTFFLHVLAGLLFGLLFGAHFGVLWPLQFVRALRLRFGILHRLAGRVFVLAGAGLALSGLGLLLQVDSLTTGLLDTARGVVGLALIAAFVLGVPRHGLRDATRGRRAFASPPGCPPLRKPRSVAQSPSR